MPYTDERLQKVIEKHTEGFSDEDLEILELILDEAIFPMQEEISLILQSSHRGPLLVPKFTIAALEVTKEITHILDSDLREEMKRSNNENKNLN